MLEEVRELSRLFIKNKVTSYRRYFIQSQKLTHRFSILLGERGVGKTTTLIQILMDDCGEEVMSDEVLYVQADHFLIRNYSLYQIAEDFHRYGGKTIAFDEIHKYPNWSLELKSIYDTFDGLRILASGSSALEIHKGSHDLSRRAIVYSMEGLSFREFIELKYEINLFSITFEKIIKEHASIAEEIIEQIGSLKILKMFHEYLEYGYYPYFREVQDKEEFLLTLEQNLHTTLESDLVSIYPHLNGSSIGKIKQLIAFIAQAVPFVPNWKKIKALIGIGDDRTLKTYFKYLQDAQIICILKEEESKLKHIEQGEKVLLRNPNQLFAYGSLHPNLGTVRETFFMAMLTMQHALFASKTADFLVDQQYHFEVGGRNKGNHQIKSFKDGYLAIDGIEVGSGRRIPLWLFGFLY